MTQVLFHSFFLFFSRLLNFWKSRQVNLWLSERLLRYSYLCDCAAITKEAGRGGSDDRPCTFRRSRPLCWSIVRHLGIRRTVSTTTTGPQNAEAITDKCLSMNGTCWVVVMYPAWCFMPIRANASNYLQIASDPDPITSVRFVFLGNTNKFNTG